MATLEIKAEIKIPRPVNFLVLSDGQKIPLSLVPDEDLKKVGTGYGEALIARKKELGKGRIKKSQEQTLPEKK